MVLPHFGGSAQCRRLSGNVRNELQELVVILGNEKKMKKGITLKRIQFLVLI